MARNRGPRKTWYLRFVRDLPETLIDHHGGVATYMPAGRRGERRGYGSRSAAELDLALTNEAAGREVLVMERYHGVAHRGAAEVDARGR